MVRVNYGKVSAMRHEEAMQHALGYAAGREDASGLPTKPGLADLQQPAFFAFAEAYASGWDRYNDEGLHFMVSARDAYDAWQASNGESIYRLASQSPYTLAALAATGYAPAKRALSDRFA